MSCRAEFIIEPFEEGSPGLHVMAAIEAVERHGFAAEMGPFGTSIHGDPAAVFVALQAMLEAAYGSGASRVSIQVDMDDDQ